MASSCSRRRGALMWTRPRRSARGRREAPRGRYERAGPPQARIAPPRGEGAKRQGAPVPALRIGVDIGGTFTDLVFVRPDGLLDRRKRPSTPADYSRAIV